MHDQIAATEVDTKSAWQHCNEAAQTLVQVRSSLIRAMNKAQGSESAVLKVLGSLTDSLEFEVRKVRTKLEDTHVSEVK